MLEGDSVLLLFPRETLPGIVVQVWAPQHKGEGGQACWSESVEDHEGAQRAGAPLLQGQGKS